jgi:hypothetical protein
MEMKNIAAHGRVIFIPVSIPEVPCSNTDLNAIGADSGSS